MQTFIFIPVELLSLWHIRHTCFRYMHARIVYSVHYTCTQVINDISCVHTCIMKGAKLKLNRKIIAEILSQFGTPIFYRMFYIIVLQIYEREITAR